MPQPTEPKTLHALSPRTILLLVVSGVVLAFLLVPSQKELREGILREKLCASITPVLGAERFRDGRSPIEALRSLTTERLKELAALAALKPRAQLERIFTTPSAKLQYDEFIHCFVLAAIRYVEPVSAAEAIQLVLPKSPEIPDSMRLEAYEILARNAVGSNMPEMASEILRQSCRSRESTWSTVADMVRVSRWAGRQAGAMETFRHWMKLQGEGLTPDEKKAARDLQYTLALEANLPGEALDACIEEFRRLPGITADIAELMERTHRAAVLADPTGNTALTVRPNFDGLTIPEAWRSWAMWRIAISTFVMMALTMGLTLHQIAILTEAGVTRMEAAWLASDLTLDWAGLRAAVGL